MIVKLGFHVLLIDVSLIRLTNIYRYGTVKTVSLNRECPLNKVVNYGRFVLQYCNYTYLQG